MLTLQGTEPPTAETVARLLSKMDTTPVAAAGCAAAASATALSAAADHIRIVSWRKMTHPLFHDAVFISDDAQTSPDDDMHMTTIAKNICRSFPEIAPQVYILDNEAQELYVSATERNVLRNAAASRACTRKLFTRLRQLQATMMDDDDAPSSAIVINDATHFMDILHRLETK